MIAGGVSPSPRAKQRQSFGLRVSIREAPPLKCHSSRRPGGTAVYFGGPVAVPETTKGEIMRSRASAFARSLLAGLFGLSLTSIACEPAGDAVSTSAGSTATVATPEQENAAQAKDLLPIAEDKERQFDFWLGEWDVQNRHLTNGQWQETGQARALIQSIAGGKAILEQWEGTARSPLHGFSVRTYDDELQKWVIVLNWHGGQPSAFSQMHGEFGEGRGEFFPPGDGPHGVRFTFSKPRPESCQWDQATRSAGQPDWTTNWIMSFTRAEEPTTADASNLPIKQPPEAAAAFPTSRQLDGLIGRWSGQAQRKTEDGQWQDGTVEVACSSMIEGLGLIRLADYSWDEHAFAALAFDGNRDKWVSVGVDNLRDRFTWLSGSVRDDSITQLDMRMGESTVHREVWSGIDGETVSIQHEISTDGGRTFETVLKATLERQAEE